MLGLLLASCAPGEADLPAGPVSVSEGSALLFQVADLAAQRTPEAAKKICDELADSCIGLSSRFRVEPTEAPRSRPRILCAIPLPPIPQQQGPLILVVTGKDAAGSAYVGHALVLRRHGRPVLHEPAFWRGYHYTQLVGGRAWGGSREPGEQAEQDRRVRAACKDPAALVAALVPSTTPSG